MPVRDVVQFPDRRLKAVCEPLLAPSGGAPDRDRIEALARDLLDTMAAHPGCVGIAAPQVGELVRMVCVDVSGHRKAVSCHGPLVLVDPQVVEEDGRVTMREGCLSIPDFTGNVRRAERIVVEAHSLDGRVRIACDAYEARVVLHELDHLDGVLFLDRVDSARDIFPRKQYRDR